MELRMRGTELTRAKDTGLARMIGELVVAAIATALIAVVIIVRTT